jgi:hypothetical protein
MRRDDGIADHRARKTGFRFTDFRMPEMLRHQNHSGADLVRSRCLYCASVAGAQAANAFGFSINGNATSRQEYGLGRSVQAGIARPDDARCGERGNRNPVQRWDLCHTLCGGTASTDACNMAMREELKLGDMVLLEPGGGVGQVSLSQPRAKASRRPSRPLGARVAAMKPRPRQDRAIVDPLLVSNDLCYSVTSVFLRLQPQRVLAQVEPKPDLNKSTLKLKMNDDKSNDTHRKNHQHTPRPSGANSIFSWLIPPTRL